jgi:hypothetical protein
VVEPGAGLVHVLDAAAKAWATEPSPIEHPLDVAGPPEDRWIASEAGLAHRGADGVSRVDGVVGVSRVIVTSLAVIAGGSGGVFEIVAR